MILNRKSRLVKWTYVLNGEGKPPAQTSLCRFFWRCFVWMPLFWLFAASIIAFGGLTVGFMTYKSYGGILPAALLVYVVVQYIRHNNQRLRDGVDVLGDRITDSVFVQGLATLKGKVCPIIHIQ